MFWGMEKVQFHSISNASLISSDQCDTGTLNAFAFWNGFELEMKSTLQLFLLPCLALSEAHSSFNRQTII